MTWINLHRRRRRGRLVRPLALLALPVALLVGCGSDDNKPRATPTPTSAVPAATATATQPQATATRPPATPTSPAATLTPTAMATVTPPNTNASAACQKLTTCGQCFADQNGQCLGNTTCAGRVAADAAACINAVNGCDPTALGDCLFLGCDGADASGECQ